MSGYVAELNESNEFDDIENILEEISETNIELYLLSLSYIKNYLLLFNK